MSIGIDTKELDILASKLEAAPATITPRIEAALTVAATGASTQARANAQAFADTGATARSVEVETYPLARRVIARTRAAWFNEVGSPSTGPPNPWMSGPTRVSQNKLVGTLTKIADPL